MTPVIIDDFLCLVTIIIKKYNHHPDEEKLLGIIPQVMRNAIGMPGMPHNSREMAYLAWHMHYNAIFIGS